MFQSFPVIGYEPKKAVLELLDGPFGEITLIEGEDYTLFLTPAAGKVTAEAVFVGYGIDAPSKGRDDYRGAICGERSRSSCAAVRRTARTGRSSIGEPTPSPPPVRTARQPSSTARDETRSPARP